MVRLETRLRDAAAYKRTRTKSKERQHTRFERNISRLDSTDRCTRSEKRSASRLFCRVKRGEGWRSWARGLRKEGGREEDIYIYKTAKDKTCTVYLSI